MGRFFYILCQAKGRYKKFNQFSKNFFMLKPFKSTCIHRSQFLEFASKLKSHLQHLRFIKFSIQFSDMLLVERRNMIGLFLNNEIILDGNSQFFFFFFLIYERLMSKLKSIYLRVGDYQGNLGEKYSLWK